MVVGSRLTPFITTSKKIRWSILIVVAIVQEGTNVAGVCQFDYGLELKKRN